MFSKACEYGIRAVIYIATQSIEGKRVKMSDIVEKTNSPLAFTSKIVGELTKHDIVKSNTGPFGGFEIAPQRLKEIRVSEIVKAIDGDTVFHSCGLGFSDCDDQEPCPIHDKYVNIRNELREMLENTTVHDLALGLKSGKTTLLR